MDATRTSLYRRLLRESRKLPHEFLRLFFRVKYRVEFEKPIIRTKRLSRDLKLLRATNELKHRPLQRVLDFAYGRKGKFRWELLQPFLGEPSGHIAPGAKNLRVPTYPPALVALLTSPHSRKTKPLSANGVGEPRGFSPRADPSSEEYKLLGPMSLRLKKNVLWRHHKTEIKKISPPLEVSLNTQHPDRPTDAASQTGDIAQGGLQQTGVLNKLRLLAGSVPQPGPPPRRQRVSLGLPPVKNQVGPSLPTRFLRRRHQMLLGFTPMMTYTPSTKKDKQFSLTPFPEAIPVSRHGPPRRASAGIDQLAWIDYASRVREK